MIWNAVSVGQTCKLSVAGTQSDVVPAGRPDVLTWDAYME